LNWVGHTPFYILNPKLCTKSDFDFKFRDKKIQKMMENYRKIKVIGKGSFGKAVLVHSAKDKKAKFVMKVAPSKKI
jgi:hypothetical protein